LSLIFTIYSSLIKTIDFPLLYNKVSSLIYNKYVQVSVGWF